MAVITAGHNEFILSNEPFDAELVQHNDEDRWTHGRASDS